MNVFSKIQRQNRIKNGNGNFSGLQSIEQINNFFAIFKVNSKVHQTGKSQFINNDGYIYRTSGYMNRTLIQGLLYIIFPRF